MPDTSAPREAPVLDDAQINLVQDSFAKVDVIAEDAAAMFYARLFEIAPDLQPLFKGDMKAQGRKLMTMIKTAVNGQRLGRPGPRPGGSGPAPPRLRGQGRRLRYRGRGPALDIEQGPG